MTAFWNLHSRACGKRRLNIYGRNCLNRGTHLSLSVCIYQCLGNFARGKFFCCTWIYWIYFSISRYNSISKAFVVQIVDYITIISNTVVDTQQLNKAIVFQISKQVRNDSISADAYIKKNCIACQNELDWLHGGGSGGGFRLLSGGRQRRVGCLLQRR